MLCRVRRRTPEALISKGFGAGTLTQEASASQGAEGIRPEMQQRELVLKHHSSQLVPA